MITFNHVHKDLQGNVAVEIEYRVHEECGIHDIMQEFRRFLLAVSFNSASIDEYIEAN